MNRTSFLLAALVAAYGTPALAADPAYTVVDLGSSYYHFQQINDAGAIAGGNGPQAGVWQAGAWTNLPDAGLGSEATVINDRGDAAGEIEHTHPGEFAVMWKAGAQKMHMIKNPWGGISTTPTGITHDRTVVGFGQTRKTLLPNCFSWKEGVTTDLGKMGSGDSCSAYGVNESLQIVGAANVVAGGVPHAFLYAGGTFKDLGNFGGEQAMANGINAQGHVVGYAMLADFTSHAFLYQGGPLVDLGVLDGSRSTATAINASDVIIGTSDNSWHGTTGFVYTGGKMYNLSDVTTDAADWTFNSVSSINDAGVIIGFGTLNGFFHEFMLVPAAH